jgi:hypothetical protein
MPMKPNIQFGAASPFTTAQSKITRFLHQKGNTTIKYKRERISPSGTPSLIIIAKNEDEKDKIEDDMKTMPGIQWENRRSPDQYSGLEPYSVPLFTVKNVLVSVDLHR